MDTVVEMESILFFVVVEKKKNFFFALFLKKVDEKFGGFIFLPYLCLWKRNDRVERFLLLEVHPTYTMRTHIDFSTSTPIVSNGKGTFSGMTILNYGCVFDEERNRIIECFDLEDKYEYWGIPTLLATISNDMRYWEDFRLVSSVSDLQDLVKSVIDGYTSDDLSKYIGWDDFDDYLVLLHITADEIRRGKVVDEDLIYYNTLGDEYDEE